MKTAQSTINKEFNQILTAFRETKEMFLSTDKKFQDTDKKFQDTDRKFLDTDKKIKALANLFTTQWGKLVEALVEPACLQLFKERDIKINYSFQNVKAVHGRETMEIDILLVNSTELVVVEVKTTCRPSDVNEIIEKMNVFKKHFPQYSEYKAYGALAALKYESQADKLAYRDGLFALKATGEGVVKIANDKKFIPKRF